LPPSARAKKNYISYLRCVNLGYCDLFKNQLDLFSGNWFDQCDPYTPNSSPALSAIQSVYISKCSLKIVHALCLELELLKTRIFNMVRMNNTFLYYREGVVIRQFLSILMICCTFHVYQNFEYRLSHYLKRKYIIINALYTI
jgi:hypothetical protein